MNGIGKEHFLSKNVVWGPWVYLVNPVLCLFFLWSLIKLQESRKKIDYKVWKMKLKWKSGHLRDLKLQVVHVELVPGFMYISHQCVTWMFVFKIHSLQKVADSLCLFLTRRGTNFMWSTKQIFVVLSLILLTNLGHNNNSNFRNSTVVYCTL